MVDQDYQCPECGHEVLGSAKFCGFCGCRIGQPVHLRASSSQVESEVSQHQIDQLRSLIETMLFEGVDPLEDIENLLEEIEQEMKIPKGVAFDVIEELCSRNRATDLQVNLYYDKTLASNGVAQGNTILSFKVENISPKTIACVHITVVHPEQRMPVVFPEIRTLTRSKSRKVEAPIRFSLVGQQSISEGQLSIVSISGKTEIYRIDTPVRLSTENSGVSRANIINQSIKTMGGGVIDNSNLSAEVEGPKTTNWHRISLRRVVAPADHAYEEFRPRPLNVLGVPASRVDDSAVIESNLITEEGSIDELTESNKEIEVDNKQPLESQLLNIIEVDSLFEIRLPERLAEKDMEVIENLIRPDVHVIVGETLIRVRCDLGILDISSPIEGVIRNVGANTGDKIGAGDLIVKIDPNALLVPEENDDLQEEELFLTEVIDFFSHYRELSLMHKNEFDWSPVYVGSSDSSADGAINSSLLKDLIDLAHGVKVVALLIHEASNSELVGGAIGSWSGPASLVTGYGVFNVAMDQDGHVSIKEDPYFFSWKTLFEQPDIGIQGDSEGICCWIGDKHNQLIRGSFFEFGIARTKEQCEKRDHMLKQAILKFRELKEISSSMVSRI